MRPAESVARPALGPSASERLSVARSVDPVAWNAAVSALNGTIFHAAEWATYVRASQSNAQPIYYSLIAGDGTVAGTALAFRAEASRPLAGRFTRRQWLDALPVVRDGSPATATRFLEMIEADARGAGALGLSVGSYASPETEPLLAPRQYALTRRFEFELDLNQDEQALWEGLDAKRRRNVRKAIRAGVDVRVLSDEGAAHLRRLQGASFVRIAARGGPSAQHRPRTAGDPISILTATDRGRLVGGFVDGACVTASFFTTFNGLAYYAMGGHDQTALDTQAPTLLLWKMILAFRTEGFRYLNFGGCAASAVEESSPEHGVYTYKRAFGARHLSCASGEKTLRPGLQRIVSLAKRIAR